MSDLRKLLSEGLDLCVRARTLDAMDRRTAALASSSDPDGWIESGRFDTFVERNNIRHPYQPISTRSATVALWLLEQYDQDLANWEARVRRALSQEDANG